MHLHGHTGDPHYSEPRYTTEDPSRTEQALFYAERMGDFEHAARLIEAGDVFALCHLTDEEWAGLRVALRRRGLFLVTDETEAFVEYLAVCVWCRQEHAADDPHAACAGPVPVDEIDPDSIDTGEACAICLKAKCGPPYPFCCSGRARLIRKVEGTGPFKACTACHGQGCKVCDGTGVAGVL
jgi:hypothetical protein